MHNIYIYIYSALLVEIKTTTLLFDLEK